MHVPLEGVSAMIVGVLIAVLGALDQSIPFVAVGVGIALIGWKIDTKIRGNHG